MKKKITTSGTDSTIEECLDAIENSTRTRTRTRIEPYRTIIEFTTTTGIHHTGIHTSNELSNPVVSSRTCFGPTITRTHEISIQFTIHIVSHRRVSATNER